MRDTVLLVRQQQPMPVSRGGLVPELIVNADAREVALAESQCRSWNAAIDGESAHRLTRRADHLFRDGKVILNHALPWLGLG